MTKDELEELANKWKDLSKENRLAKDDILGQIYKEFHKLASQWLLWKTGRVDPDIAGTATSNACLYLDKYQAGTNIKQWLLRIVHNVWFDWVYRRWPDDSLVPIEGEVSQSGKIIDPNEELDTHILLNEILDFLPQEEREVVKAYFEGEKATEIAKRLAITNNEVKRRMQSAKRMLVKVVGDEVSPLDSPR